MQKSELDCLRLQTAIFLAGNILLGLFMLR